MKARALRLVIAWFLIGASSLPALSAGFPAGGRELANEGFCGRVVQNVDRIGDLDALRGCMDFYWQNPQFDEPPGSFNRIIRLGYRVILLDPHDEETTTNVIWLLYSKYATWRKAPDQMPDGAQRAEEAIALAHAAIEDNPNSASLPLEIGHLFEGLVQYYLREQVPLLYQLYERANQRASDDRTRIRARLDLGHAHRKYGTCGDALHWYREVLSLDSSNAAALRGISKLTCAQ